MRTAVWYWVACVLVAGFSSITYGAGNASAGKTKALACSGCHGADGNSSAPIFPRLAGQHEKYIVRQLQDFKSQKRSDPSMQAMAASLSDQDMEDLGAYFSSQKPVYPNQDQSAGDSANPPSKESISAGKSVFFAGNEASGVAACTACHGPNGSGNALAGFPVIKGQFLPYLLKSLNDFKDGLRTNDDGAMMRTIAGSMSKVEIDAVTAYISDLR